MREVAAAGATVPGRLTRALDDVAAALTELEQVPGSVTSTDELAAVIRRVPELAARFDAQMGQLLDRAEARCVAQLNGKRRLDQWLLAETNAAGVDVRSRLRTVRWLRDFPQFAEAHAYGVLTAAHLDKLRKGLDTPRTHRLLSRDQASLIEAARTCSFKDFERVCDYWKIAADPDGDEPRDQLDQTYLRMRRRSDQMVKVDGLLDPVAGAAAMAAWERELQKLAVTDDETGKHRSNGKRGVAALLNLLSRGAARADGSHAEPLINIVMSLAVAEAAIERYVHEADVDVPLDPKSIDGRCELIDGTPIHPSSVAELLTTAALRRVVFSARSRPIDLSYDSRSFPKWIKHILLIRSRGRCDEDGCDAPAAWLQADHVVPDSRGGPTRLDNGQILCRAHNLAKSNR